MTDFDELPENDETPFYDGPSKSQVKRELHSLQTLGLNIAHLPAKPRATIPMPDGLVRAIDDYLAIKSNRAKKRQAQYIGKQMRLIDDISDIETAYQKIVDAKNHLDADFHLCERWRDRLLSDEPTALTEFINAYPQASRQHLRHLVQKARLDKAKAINSGAATALFRYIKELS